MKKLADDLKSVNKEINALSKKLEQLSKKADKLLKAVAGKKVKTKAVPKKKTVKKKANVAKAAAVKKTVKKEAKKPVASDTPTSKVLTLMKRYKKGVAIAKLKQGSGLSDKQISNILHRASKEGKIKRVARGVYQLA
jgi:predicted Rossmann fold nucleotide-binding protein DprA/Smf involved in DNA uptake